MLLLDGGTGPVIDASDGPRLLLLDAGRASSALAKPERLIFLGTDAGGRAHLAVRDSAGELPDLPEAAGSGVRWAGLREVGALLDDTGAGILTTAVALANWHATHHALPAVRRADRGIALGLVEALPGRR